MTTLDPDVCPACGGSPYAPDGVSRCPRCRGTGTAAGAPVAVDVPAGTPGTRREAVTAPDLDQLPPVRLSAVRSFVRVYVYGPGLAEPVRLPEAEAARRLLAFDALLAACQAWDAAGKHTGCHRCGGNLRGDVWFCEEKCRLLAEAERLTAAAVTVAQP